MSLSKKAAKAKQPAVKKSILTWLQEKHDEGHQLSIKWDGGGDSGWCYFEIDGDTTDNEYTNALVDAMYDTLDYGSWAGEFQANGEAIYYPEYKTFEGTDYYSEDDHEILNPNITINVPKKLWFESLHIECEANYDEAPDFSIRFIVRNGFLTKEHEDFCTFLQEEIKEKLNDIFNQYQSSNNEFRGCNDSWILERNEAEEDGDDLLFTIDKVEIQTMTTEDKSIVLELDEDFVEKIDNKLNKKENAD